MAVDEDTLRTLTRIEKLLQSNLTGGKQSGPKVAGGQDTNDSAPKTIKATAASVKALGESTEKLSRTFDSLNRTVLNTRANLIEMNRTIRQVRPPGGNGGNNPTPTPGPVPIILPNNPAPSPTPQPLPFIPPAPNPTPQPLPIIPPSPNPGPTPPTPPTPPPGPAPGGNLPPLIRRIGVVGTSVINVLSQFKGAIEPLVRDYLKISSVGINADQAMAGMAKSAALAGMSLADYNAMIVESSVAVSRAGSMEAFNNQILTTTTKLRGLGIFGEDAAKLGASLATSATTLGVPQQALASATDAQVGVFEQLRKSSLLTADSFQQLTASLSQQQEVQSNLLGMAPTERAARLADITGMKTFGLSLGGSKAASDAFGDALLKQRDQTVARRFESAGRIRQSGAVLGMATGDAEQLAQLSRKKNLTGEDAAVAMRLGSELQTRIEQAMNSGDANRENIAEQLQASLDSSGIGTLLKSAGNLSLTTQSGPARANADFSKGASNLLLATGKMMEMFDGAAKSPIISSLLSALGSAAFSLGLGKIFGAAITGFNAGGFTGAFKAIIDVIKLGGTTLMNLFRSMGNIGGLFTGLKTMVMNMLGGLGPGLMGGIKTVLGGAFKFLGGSGIISAAFGGIMEMFTGDIGNALNAADDKKWFGDGIMGFTDKLLGKVMDVVGGMIRGFFTGFTSLGDLLISGWNATMGSLFSSLQINLSGTLTNFFDNMWTSMTIMFKESKLKVAKFFGMTDTAKELEADIAKAKETKDILMKDGSATLTTVGDKGKALLAEQKATADKTTTALTQATSATAVAGNVITTTEGLTQRLVSDVRSPNTQAIATPAQINRPTVTQPGINTPTTAAPTAPTPTTSAPSTAPAPTTLDALLVQMTQMNQTLLSMLTVEQQQALGLDGISRALGRPGFTDNETKLKALTR